MIKVAHEADLAQDALCVGDVAETIPENSKPRRWRQGQLSNGESTHGIFLIATFLPVSESKADLQERQVLVAERQRYAPKQGPRFVQRGSLHDNTCKEIGCYLKLGRDLGR